MSDDNSTWYGADSKPLREKFSAGTAACMTMVDRHFGAEVELAQQMLDASYAVACHYSWCLDAPHIVRLPKHLMISLAAFHKGLFTLTSCIDLTRRGLYGPARPLLRHAFEFLMLAKFCCVSPDSHIHDRWQNDETIYFTNGILKRIASPDVLPFAELWNELNELTHATRSSSQIGLHFPIIAHELQVNFALVRVLADWLAHLLTKHVITRSMRDMTLRHTPACRTLASAEKTLHSTLKESRRQHSKASKTLVATFRRTWVVKDK